MTDGQPKIVSWEEPPPEAEDLGAYGLIATELRGSRGQWARLPDRASPAAAQAFASGVRKGAQRAFRPRGAFDARSHESSVWVRYTGNGPPDGMPPQQQAADVGKGQGDRHTREEGAAIRAWADSKGYGLQERGRIPNWVSNAYELAVNRGEV